MERIEQGDIFWVNLGQAQGSEQAGIRPAIIAQVNPLNRQLKTIIVIPLTTNLKKNDFMTTHFLPKEKTGLKRDSVALMHQVKALDKRRIFKKAGHINKEDYFEIRFKLIQNVW